MNNSQTNIKILYFLIGLSFALLFLCIIAIIFLFRKNKTEPSKFNTLNYSSSKSNQAITTVDSVGNLSYLSFPTGIIVVWYPTDSDMTSLNLVSKSVPSGWAICDGTQGTPDLRGRFVLMAQDTKYPIMSIGGEEKHVLTVSEMPTHTHEYQARVYGSGCGNGVQITENENQNCSTSSTSSTGGNNPHNNMPPFYTLVYIMKL